MSMRSRIELALESAVQRAEATGGPPRLSAAIRYAVFPGGARVRPNLCLAVAAACGDDSPELAEATAAAIELLHCASLVHDDLPCFDDASTRRGKPSVHAGFGQALAVLTGDALIVMAFDVIAKVGSHRPGRLAPILSTITRGVGMPAGIVAGQAWEAEPNPLVQPYHRAKTGALFVAAATGGALAAGSDPAPWRLLGEKLGEAYQVADDLLDALSSQDEAGKPTGRDGALQRPNCVAEIGVESTYARLQGLVVEAAASVPQCDGAAALRDLVRMQATRLAPRPLARGAA